MSLRKTEHWFAPRPAPFDSLAVEPAAANGHTRDWRDAAREMGRRLTPVLVLAAAALLGMAAVAIT